MKGDSLCWRVSSPHAWEGSPRGGPSRDWLGFRAWSEGPCSQAPCTDPLVVLCLLRELLEVAGLGHCLLQKGSDLGLLVPFLAIWGEGDV